VRCPAHTVARRLALLGEPCGLNDFQAAQAPLCFVRLVTVKTHFPLDHFEHDKDTTTYHSFHRRASFFDNQGAENKCACRREFRSANGGLGA